MRDIPQDIIDALEEDVLRPVVFVEVLFDMPLRFTSATADYVYNGLTFEGAGDLGSVTDPTENEDLDPQKLEIVLTGIKPSVLQAVRDSRYLNRSVTVWWGLLDDQGVLLGNTAMVRFIGKTDEVRFQWGGTRTVKITARDKLADWSRPRIERNTNADQQAKYPGDKGFEFAAQVADKKIIWPKGEFFE